MTRNELKDEGENKNKPRSESPEKKGKQQTRLVTVIFL